MLVHKFIPVINHLPKIGDDLMIIPSNYKGREQVEDVLENYRKSFCPDEISRLVGSFVIPSKDNLEELIHEYARKSAPNPDDKAIVYLLDIETEENVSWHDHDKYNDLCMWFEPVGLRVGDKDKLIMEYWTPIDPNECESPEGLITSGKIRGIHKCNVFHSRVEILD